VEAFVNCVIAGPGNNQAGVMAFATLVTALATLIVAWATCVNSRIVALEKKIERANRMPLICFTNEKTGDYRSLFVKTWAMDRL
jgi:hypothetical protein